MKRIAAIALLSLPLLASAQDKDAYLDCLLEWGTRGNTSESMKIVFRACALKHFDEERAMDMEHLFEPFEGDDQIGKKFGPSGQYCDPVFGDGECSRK